MKREKQNHTSFAINDNTGNQLVDQLELKFHSYLITFFIWFDFVSFIYSDALCEEITADPNEDDEVEDDEEIVNDLNRSSYGINDEDVVPLDMSRVKCENNVCFEQPINMSSKRTTSSSSSSSNNIKNNKMSSSSAQYNYGSFIANGASKPVDDDEDDEDDDGEHGERLSEQNGAYDPERLKAFNVIQLNFKLNSYFI